MLLPDKSLALSLISISDAPLPGIGPSSPGADSGRHCRRKDEVSMSGVPHILQKTETCGKWALESLNLAVGTFVEFKGSGALKHHPELFRPGNSLSGRPNADLGRNWDPFKTMPQRQLGETVAKGDRSLWYPEKGCVVTPGNCSCWSGALSCTKEKHMELRLRFRLMLWS